MKINSLKLKLTKIIVWFLPLGLICLLVSCTSDKFPIASTSLNSRYTEEQPSLSGDGKFLAYISNRQGTHQLLLYDLQRQQIVATPSLNRSRTILESPSLSYRGRYITYITNDRGRSVIGLYDRALERSQILNPVHRGWIRNPSISPDGRYIVFETSNRGQWDIEVLDRGENIELDIPNGSLVPAPRK
ncbi:MAG: hypothetical protein AAF378_02730 [Cyanobacteria bacterium P01_A01_bin.84]